MSLINARFTTFPRRRKYGVAFGLELLVVNQRQPEGTYPLRARTRKSNADSLFVRLAGPTPRFDSSWQVHISFYSPSWRFKVVATDLDGIDLGRNLSLMRKTRKPCGVCRSFGSLHACDFSVMFENQIVYRSRLTIFGVSPSSTTLGRPAKLARFALPQR